MPIISITLRKIPVETKKELIETLSTKASEITGVPLDAFSVLIYELEDDSIGVGGKTLTDVLKDH